MPFSLKGEIEMSKRPVYLPIELHDVLNYLKRENRI